MEAEGRQIGGLGAEPPGNKKKKVYAGPAKLLLQTFNEVFTNIVEPAAPFPLRFILFGFASP